MTTHTECIAVFSALKYTPCTYVLQPVTNTKDQRVVLRLLYLSVHPLTATDNTFTFLVRVAIIGQKTDSDYVYANCIE